MTVYEGNLISYLTGWHPIVVSSIGLPLLFVIVFLIDYFEIRAIGKGKGRR